MAETGLRPRTAWVGSLLFPPHLRASPRAPPAENGAPAPSPSEAEDAGRSFLGAEPGGTGPGDVPPWAPAPHCHTSLGSAVGGQVDFEEFVELMGPKLREETAHMLGVRGAAHRLPRGVGRGAVGGAWAAGHSLSGLPPTPAETESGVLGLWRHRALQTVGLGPGRGWRGFGSAQLGAGGGPPREASWGRKARGHLRTADGKVEVAVGGRG